MEGPRTTAGPGPQDAPSLLAATLRHGADLLRGELSLAKAEAAKKVSLARSALVFVAAAAVLGIVALNALANAIIVFLVSAGWPPGLAALAVAVVFLAIAGAFAWTAQKRLEAADITSSRTAKSLKRDAQSLKEASNA